MKNNDLTVTIALGSSSFFGDVLDHENANDMKDFVDFYKNCLVSNVKKYLIERDTAFDDIFISHGVNGRWLFDTTIKFKTLEDKALFLVHYRHGDIKDYTEEQRK